MRLQLGLTKVEEFRELLAGDAYLVITDNVHKTATLHSDPSGCSHVQERSFEQKVVTNRGANGSYHRVGSLKEAESRWPHLRVCSSVACGGAAL